MRAKSWARHFTLENCSKIVVDWAHLEGIQHAVDSIVDSRVQRVYVDGTACILVGCAALGTVADADGGQENRHGSVYIHLDGYAVLQSSDVICSARRDEYFKVRKVKCIRD